MQNTKFSTFKINPVM